MGTFILGWTLIAFGGSFVFVGLIAASRQAFTKPPSSNFKLISPIKEITELLEAIADVVRALGDTPLWLALVLVGISLIVAGERVLSGQSVLPFAG